MDEKVKEFKENCQGYLAQKNWLKELEENTYVAKESSPVHDRKKEMVEENLKAVDDGLHNIEEAYGERAKMMIYEAYVLKEKQVTLAHKYGLPLRTLQRRLHNYVQACTK